MNAFQLDVCTHLTQHSIRKSCFSCNLIWRHALPVDKKGSSFVFFAIPIALLLCFALWLEPLRRLLEYQSKGASLVEMLWGPCAYLD